MRACPPAGCRATARVHRIYHLTKPAPMLRRADANRRAVPAGQAAELASLAQRGMLPILAAQRCLWQLLGCASLLRRCSKMDTTDGAKQTKRSRWMLEPSEQLSQQLLSGCCAAAAAPRRSLARLHGGLHGRCSCSAAAVPACCWSPPPALAGSLAWSRLSPLPRAETNPPLHCHVCPHLLMSLAIAL